MTVADSDLIAAIESTLTFYDPVPGVSEALGIPGLDGRVTVLSDPLANLVTMARLDERNADATIARVKERFGGNAFGWVTGPSTTPRDLPERLERAGFVVAERLAGMALTDLDRPIAAPPVRIDEVAPADAGRESEMMARAYGMPREVNDLFLRLLGAQRRIRVRGYFAYEDGKPVAWSNLVYVPNTPIVLLGGAATVPEARGHGLYTALTKRRLDDARADGREAAVIQGDRTTSAPICAKLGFRELCALEFYAWTPEPPKA
ncbi:MAG TPA: GNAT family N-acetyltransferase [Candidatus Limnocylindria bacterium]